ncbi:MAG TPA: Rieske 2Fe-2S domain-containing protein, partial [Blastocatellia bacterium]|nr:Rieske 2Fe-2S domain-containing protein [Blastocatellia bacterium]
EEMSSNVAIDLIERQGWLDEVSDALQPAIAETFRSAGEVGQKVEDFLHGTWLGHPLHSVLTDIPVGAWTAALVLDAMDEMSGREEFGRGADAAVAVGIVGAVASAVTGLTDWHKTDGAARRIGITHGLMNATALALYATSLACRRRKDRRAGRGLSFLGYAIASASAYLGGHLVYGEQIGVDHTADQDPPREFVRVMAEADLREGEPHRADAAGMPVLLVRRGGRVFAIAETCSHLGGPLADGKLEGDSVRCPWHGSRFSLEDGRVLEGPSVHTQPCFEARVRDGQIEVRSANR